MLCSAGSLPDSLMDDLADCYVTFLNSSKVGLAYFLGQCGHESAGLRYPMEIASGAAYNGRADLGNIYPGDGENSKAAALSKPLDAIGIRNSATANQAGQA